MSLASLLPKAPGPCPLHPDARSRKKQPPRYAQDTFTSSSRRRLPTYRSSSLSRQSSSSEVSSEATGGGSIRKKRRSPFSRTLSLRKRESPPVLPLNDPEGHLVYSLGDVICSRFRILSSLGEGTFGRVLRVKDLFQDKERALKVIKNFPKYRKAANLEIAALESLANCDLIVRCFDSFDYFGHKCLLFEILGESVFEFLRSNDYAPYPLAQVSSIASQVLSALEFMHGLRLTHTDLKPENILFRDRNWYISSATVNGRRTLLRRMASSAIKLIDLGSATFEWEHHSGVVCTRHYRAPEVILELGWSYPVDIWSLGCIVHELFRGRTLFQTHSNREHLAMMSAVTGRSFPLSLVRNSSKYFTYPGGDLRWDPNSREAAYINSHVRPLRATPGNRVEARLVDLVLKCLELDPDLRPRVAYLRMHPFFDDLRSLGGGHREDREMEESLRRLKI